MPAHSSTNLGSSMSMSEYAYFSWPNIFGSGHFVLLNSAACKPCKFPVDAARYLLLLRDFVESQSGIGSGLAATSCVELISCPAAPPGRRSLSFTLSFECFARSWCHSSRRFFSSRSSRSSCFFNNFALQMWGVFSSLREITRWGSLALFLLLMGIGAIVRCAPCPDFLSWMSGSFVAKVRERRKVEFRPRGLRLGLRFFLLADRPLLLMVFLSSLVCAN
mmetsp:Transcript_7149/g.17344  ORF Transcript_7149/g.17344 Transcript_7149/m.17344 type:complete len:220 (-) Transcript_7149:953-1612(-)